MENKTTTELLDLIYNFEKQAEKKDDMDWNKYEEITTELKKRYPFSEILGEKDDPNDYTLEEKIEDLEEDTKHLKRHKHDKNSGDVMIRI